MKKYIVGSLCLLLVSGLVYGATSRYMVQAGDTWQSIASKHGVTVEQLANMNQPKRWTRINVPIVAPVPTPVPPPSAGEIVFSAYLTAYTWWDNTPPGSADIALPVIHSKAGGTGTYADPITLAVGHVISGGKSTPDYPKGTMFYFPHLKRYFIVEDLCGDGNTPQNGPCHKNTDRPGYVWLDMWIGGQSGTRSSTNACAENLTNVFPVIQNPVSTYPVTAGAIFENGCK